MSVKNNPKILYDSEPESVEEGEIVPQTTQVQAPAPKPRAPKQAKQEIKKPENWSEFVDDKLEDRKVEQKPKLYCCDFCGKSFVRNYHLNRHIQEQRCNVKRNMDVAREAQLKQMEAEIMEKLKKKELRKERKALKEKIPPPAKPKKAVQQTKPVEQPVQQPVPQRPYPKYTINF